jgi:hypothetical protein
MVPRSSLWFSIDNRFAMMFSRGADIRVLVPKGVVLE